MKNFSFNLIGLLVLLSACGTANNPNANVTPSPTASAVSNSPASPKIKVVATFLPIYWFTKAIAQDQAEVNILVNPGTDVHDYQATPDNVKAIATAQVLVKNGLGIEEFLDDTVKNAGNSKLQVIDSSAKVEVIKELSPVVEVKKDDHHEHDHEGGNPHIWLDPVNAIKQVTYIKDGLIKADPVNKAVYEANALAYIKQLEDLDLAYKTTLSKYPNCTFITFHDAYPYLAKRYNLKQVAVVEIPEDNLTPNDIKKTVDTVKKYQVKTLFGEPGIDNKLIDGLSKDLGLTLQTLDSLETGALDPQTYFTAMKDNLQKIQNSCK